MSVKKSVYDIIKRQNGEAFARAIRNFDNGIFDIPNLPRIVRYAGRDAEPLLNYLEALKLSKCKIQQDRTSQNPFELLKKAGYDAFYADTLEKQNSIMNYYADMESLCTFRDEKRFEKYHIIHCIKEGADKLNRRDFRGKERREDEYGTSVISIQILKKGGFISIKNRYNHTVQAPDNTFYSNPDNIIAGLSQALMDYFNLTYSSGLPNLDNGFMIVDDLIYQYHIECNNIYFGPNYYIRDNQVTFINKDYQLIIDNFIIDFKENKVYLPYQSNFDKNPLDAFFKLVQKEVEGKKLTLQRKGDLSWVYAQNECILKARNGSLIYANLKGPDELKQSIFSNHSTIEEIYFENVTELSTHSIHNCARLKKAYFPKCLVVNSDSFTYVPLLEEVDLSKVKTISSSCFCDKMNVKELNFPCLVKIEKSSFQSMSGVEKITAPVLKNMGDGVLMMCDTVQEVDFPLLKNLEGFNFYLCPMLEKVFLPKVKKIGENSLTMNKGLQELNCPVVEEIGEDVVCSNKSLRIVHMPKLKRIGANSFSSNDSLKHLILNEVLKVESGAISSNKNLTYLSLKKVEELDANCFFDNPKLKRIYLDAYKGEDLPYMFYGAKMLNEIYSPYLDENSKKVLQIYLHQKIRWLSKKDITNERDS